MREPRKKREQALWPKLFLSGILGFQDAVGGEKDDITRSQFDSGFIVLAIGNESQRDAFETNRLHTSAADEKRIRAAGVGEGVAARGSIVGREEHSDEARVEPVVIQTAIESREHFRGRAQMSDHVLAEYADGERAVERGSGAFAGNVPEREAETALSIGEEIVKITPPIRAREHMPRRGPDRELRARRSEAGRAESRAPCRDPAGDEAACRAFPDRGGRFRARRRYRSPAWKACARAPE